MYRKGSYIAARIIGLAAVLVLTALFAVQTPPVQTRLSKYALDRLTSAADGRIMYDQIKIIPSGALVIKNILILDKNPYTEDINARGWERVDTILTAKTVTATFSLPSLLKPGSIRVGRVMVDGGEFHLTLEPNSVPGGKKNITNIERAFGLGGKKKEKKALKGELFSVGRVSVSNFRFRLNSFKPQKVKYKDGAMNFDDLDVLISCLKGHGIKMTDGRVKATLDRLSLTEKSGYMMLNLSARCSVGPGKTIVEDIRLRDPWSEINVKYYSMGYENARSFSKYVSEVLMEGEISRSKLTLHSLSFFANSVFRNYSTRLDLNGGHVRGYVNDLHVEGLSFSDPESGIRLDGLDCSATGMPDIQGMMASVDLKGLHFTASGIRKISAGIVPSGIKIPHTIGRGQHFTLNASAKGPLNRLKGTVHLRSEAGRLKLEADVRNLLDKRRDTEIGLRLGTAALDIGAVSGLQGLGRCDLYTEARGILRKKHPDLRIDSLKLGRLNAVGYNFRDITAKGHLNADGASLIFDSTDPNLMMSMDAEAAFSQDGGKSLRLNADLANLDLQKLGIDRKRGTSRTAMKINGNVKQNGKAVNGSVKIGNIRLWNNNGLTDLGDIDFKLYNIAEEQCLSIDSGFADLFISGSGSIAEFAEDLQDITTRRELPALYPDTKKDAIHGKYDLDLLMHDSRGLLSFVFPGLYIADSTRATMSISRSGELVGNATSSRLAYGTTFIKDADLQFDNLGESLSISLIGQNFKSGKFDLDRPDISLLAKDNTLSASLRFESFSLSGGSGELYANGEFYRDSTNTLVIKARPLESYISAGNGVWDIGESDVVIRGKDVYVKGFRISNGNQLISIDGGISQERDDTLSLSIKGLDLAQTDDFLPRSYGIRGTVDGKAMLTSRSGRAKGMLMDMRIDSLKIGDTDAGSLQLASILEDGGDDINIYLRNELEGRNPLYATGMYFPDDGRIYLDAELDRLPLEIAGPFLTEIFSELDGSVSGSIRLDGQTGNMSLSSKNLMLNDARLRPSYTGVLYTVNGPLEVAGDGVRFSSLQLRDDAGGSGLISGGIDYDHLRDFSLKSEISFNNLKLIDSPQRSSGVYGLLKASGSASVNGPFTALSISATASTVGDGNIHVPMSGTAAEKTSDLLTFTEPAKAKDPYEEMISSIEERKRRQSDIDIHANVNVHSGIKAFVEIDKSAGNTASLSGDGNVNLHLRPAKAIFDLNGEFSIREGNYQFVIPGILSKDFNVAEGSSIKFGGDIADTELDINVIYKQKASLSALVAEESKTGTKRLVECGISVSDRLRNPKIGFSVNVPDLDPTTKSLVEAALSTEDKVQKQFMALLLMGSFIPDENSGVVNGSEILVSNVTELMSNQLNSILQKLEIPVDVGIGYQGTYQGSNMFDVAISTQLFNDRVIVGGSVANRKYNNTASSGDMVGDLDIQIKLDDEGKFRLNIFSHSADEYTSYLDLSQRNGVGVSYQKEYLGFSDFISSIFGKKKPEADEDKAGTTIKIEADGQRKTVSDTLSLGK